MQQEQALRTQSEALVATLQRLRQEEADVADEAGALGADAVALAKQAETVVQRKQTLVEQAADLQVQAANLQVQAGPPDAGGESADPEGRAPGQQQQAQSQQQQAEQLQTTLTNELTKAGDERGTDPRLVKLQNDLTATLGVKVSPPHQQGWQRRDFHGHRHHCSGCDGDGRPGPHAAHVHNPAGDVGDECRCVRGRPDRELRRSRQRDLVAADARDPRGHRSASSCS